MANEEPAFLTAGIEVSAKYRGAFCEAKVKKVDKNVKCKVTLKDDGKVLIVQDEDIKGSLRVGATVEVQRPDSGQFVEGTLNRISDISIYTVVFDDGDENTLRRSKLCLKGDRHFMKSETLDDLPLTHPEHFGTPVIRKNPKSKGIQNATCSESELEEESSDDDSEAGKKMYTILSHQNLVGQVLCVECEERNRRATTVPALVVLPSADEVQLPTRHHVLVKSFKDGKFFTTTISNTKEFSPEIIAKNKDKALKIAFEKAQNYKEKKELPQSWSKMELLGYSSAESDESSDDEPDEKKDRFVAELFKFMDDRGTPINKAPNLGGIDLNLFKLFRIVQSMGGYNRVTNQMKWHVVHSKLNLPSSASIVYTNIKQAYKKFLHAFEDFYRKLGCTMVNSSHTRISSRSLVSFRERDRDQTPKLSRNRRAGSIKDEDCEKVQLKGEPEAEKTDKLNAAIPSNKTGVGGGGASGGGASVKTKVPKKSTSKKDSGDSDSISSDTVTTPRSAAPVPPASSAAKTSAESIKPSLGVSLRVTKDAEKQQSTPKTSFPTSKEELARVTRGDSLKAKDSAVKEERLEKSKVATKGDGKDHIKTRVEPEKSAEKTDTKKKKVPTATLR